MIEHDTVRLLRECDAGAKMGIDAINDVWDYVKNEEFLEKLDECRRQHLHIEGEINEQLARFKDEGKDPPFVAKEMSRMKCDMKLMMNKTDNTVADLITDGCNMGVKSLSKYLNEYEAADERSKELAKRLIRMEELLAKNIRCYL